MACNGLSLLNMNSSQIVSERTQTAAKILKTGTPSSLSIQVIVIDRDGIGHESTRDDFLPHEVIASQLLDKARQHFKQQESDEACICLEQLVGDFSTSVHAPEAIYLLGIIHFLQDHDQSHLIGIHNRLASEYPHSEWLQKASVYELLK